MLLFWYGEWQVHTSSVADEIHLGIVKAVLVMLLQVGVGLVNMPHQVVKGIPYGEGVWQDFLQRFHYLVQRHFIHHKCMSERNRHLLVFLVIVTDIMVRGPDSIAVHFALYFLHFAKVFQNTRVYAGEDDFQSIALFIGPEGKVSALVCSVRPVLVVKHILHSQHGGEHLAVCRTWDRSAPLFPRQFVAWGERNPSL